MTNASITTGMYPGSTYVNYYNLSLNIESNVFLEVSNDNGSSAVYNSQMQIISATSVGSPIHLLAGTYTVRASYSSPTYAVMNVYIPSESSYQSLTNLLSGSYKANSYDNFYRLHLENSGGLFISASGDSASAIVYDENLNYVTNTSTAPLYLSAGDYIVHAQYNGYRNGVLSTLIPEELTQPAIGSESIFGTSANETFDGGTGNDSIDGQAGIDTAIHSSNYADYTIKKTSNSHSVQANFGTDGTDTLTNIERLQFADKKIALDLTPDGNAGKALEFIGMMAHSLVKTPTVVGTILSIFDQGKSMKEVCQLAIDVGLTGQLAGSTSNLDLAKLVFRNVVGSEASATVANELASYIQGSGGSMSQADFLATIAGLDLNNQHIGLVGLQSTGVEYII